MAAQPSKIDNYCEILFALADHSIGSNPPEVLLAIRSLATVMKYNLPSYYRIKACLQLGKIYAKYTTNKNDMLSYYHEGVCHLYIL